MLGTKTKEQVLDLFPENTILAAYRGSIAHGMYVPNTDPHSVDDIDLMGIFMAPTDKYIGITTPKETVEKFVDEYDLVSYEFKKMMHLLLKSNPNVLSILYIKPEHYLSITEAGQLLLDNKHLFSSTVAYNSYVGYANSQLKRMSKFSFNGYMGKRRKALVDKFGYDCKNAAHCIRLLKTGIEFLETGIVNVFRTEDAEELLDIKLGRRSLDYVKSEAARLFVKAKKAKKNSFLPEKPDYYGVNDLTKQLVYSYIKTRGI